ncbi:MAG: hypothetical protein J0M24_17545 [Verrucomicrobia bacterium]|nr:hypothetical protein [Verrucomicrobiota bacterium]
MFRSSSLAGDSPNRAFAVQAALILLPVAILALLAFTALRADRQQARLRAEQQANLTVRAVGRSAVESLRELLQRYERAREDAYHRQIGAAGPVLPISNPFVPARPPALLPTNNLPLTQWILPAAEWTTNGTLLQPRPFPASPQPPAWWIELDPELRRRWDAAQQLEDKSAPADEVIAAFNHCREVVTNYPFDANVLFQLRRLSARGEPSPAESLLNFAVNPQILSPAGLPVAGLVLLESLKQPDLAWSNRLLLPLVEAVGTFPSLLTPLILEEAERVAGTNASARTNLLLLRQRWTADQELRSVVPRLLARSPTEPPWEWIDSPPLFVARTTHPFISKSTVRAQLIPEPALRFCADQVLISSADELPDYARLQVYLQGRRLDSGSSADAPLLAIWSPSEYGELPWEFHLVLTQPDLLFADQQRRESWTAVLILAAVISAGFGVWQAHRTLRRQLALNEEKSNFVSAVSHELRSPLASVRLLAEGLAQGQVTDEAQRRQYGGFLVEETRRLGALVENILNFARIEGGRAQFEFAPTDARRLVRETVDRLQPIAQERSLQLRWTDLTGDRALEPTWDGLAVQLALTNLLDNALKHAPPSSVVTVTLETRDSLVLLSVADTGPGIPPEDHARIFERFYRRGSELRRETRGVGLGLALVKHLAEAHGGQVRVRSQVGQGATFTLELPLAGPNPAR